MLKRSAVTAIGGSERQGDAPAALAAVVLEEEAARHSARGSRDEVLFADDLLPGVGGEKLGLREGLGHGGASTFVILTLLASIAELEGGIFNVLGPDIQRTFGVSDGAIVFLGTASVAFFVLGAVPFGWLTDRTRRPPIVGVATLTFGAFAFLSGLAVNVFTMFWTRLGSGVAKANTLTVSPSLIADTYPIGVRGRLYAMGSIVAQSVGLCSPVLAGVIAELGGADGWRWAFFVLSLPAVAFAFLAFRIPEPRRGGWEQRDVLGSVLDESEELHPSMEAAFARLWRITTLRVVIVAFAAMGFYLFTGQTIMFLYLEDHFGLDATERGLAGTALGLGGLVVAPFVGAAFDRVFRVDPSKALAIIAYLLMPVAVLVPVQYAMPNVGLFVLVAAVGVALMTAAFSVVGAVTQAVVPYRLRGLGSAMTTMYIFLVGGIGAGLVGALFTNAFGERAAMTFIAVPSMLIGALMILRGSRFIRHDMSLIVADLREELEEQERQRARPEQVPALAVNSIDFSYGTVQVLFDVSFHVDRGETLALLGTNGSGKSTLLKVVTGLVTPERGVVRLHGRTVTYTTPEQRARMGVQLLPGGRGVFGSLSVLDNLVVGAYQYRHDPVDVRRRIEQVLTLLPALEPRRHDRASDLSGGQQQLLALGRVLLHDPDILVIDEFSLGLAPTVVASLLATIDELKDAGQTMIIVEQSLNVALAIADRAVFLEKGRVRFEGNTRELAERDDLARAVFLGQDGG